MLRVGSGRARSAGIAIVNAVIAAAIVLACGFVAAGHGGQSVRSTRFEPTVVREILLRLPVTLELLIGSTIVALAFGLTIAWAASRTHDRVVHRSIAALALVLQSVPFFWLALSLSVLAAVHIGDSIFGWTSSDRFSLAGHIAHLALPICIVALVQIPIVICAPSSSSDQHRGFRPASRLYAALLAIAQRLPEIVGACLIAEIAFAWPGEGRFFLNALNLADRPRLVTGVVLFGLLTLVVRALLRLTTTRPSASEVRDA